MTERGGRVTVLLLAGIYITELLKYAVWFMGIKKTKISRPVIGAVVSGAFFVLILVGVINTQTLLMVWVFFAILTYAVSMDGKGNEKVMYLLQAFFVVSSTGEIISNVIQIMLKTEWNTGPVGKWFYLISNLAVTFLFSGLIMIKRKTKVMAGERGRKLHQWGMYIVIALMGTAILLTVSGFQNMAGLLADEKVKSFSKIISIIAYLCIACLIIMISYIFNENKRYREYLEKEAVLLETQKNMYEGILIKNQETKRYRHDMQHHLMLLNELVVQGDLSKVSGYIEGMETHLRAIQNKVYLVGNDVIDAVLNYYLSMLKEGIDVEIEGGCPAGINMSDVELCTVVANIVQNAQEALNKQNTGWLKIQLQAVNQFFCLKIKNSMERDRIIWKEEAGIPITTKRKKEEHGIGIQNARETVERNGGMFNIAIDDKEFEVKIAIPIKEKENR